MKRTVRKYGMKAYDCTEIGGEILSDTTKYKYTRLPYNGVAVVQVYKFETETLVPIGLCYVPGGWNYSIMESISTALRIVRGYELVNGDIKHEQS